MHLELHVSPARSPRFAGTGRGIGVDVSVEGVGRVSHKRKDGQWLEMHMHGLRVGRIPVDFEAIRYAHPTLRDDQNIACDSRKPSHLLEIRIG